MSTWDEVLADPMLADLPYKIEINEKGRIELNASPTFDHQAIVMALALELSARKGGTTLPGCGVQFQDGSVRQPDVIWISEQRLAGIAKRDPLPIAPEICVEVLSSSNIRSEMDYKTQGYLDAGAEEVWIVDQFGTRTVHKR